MKRRNEETKSQYINELYPNRILRVNFSEIQFSFVIAEIGCVYHTAEYKVCESLCIVYAQPFLLVRELSHNHF